MRLLSGRRAAGSGLPERLVMQRHLRRELTNHPEHGGTDKSSDLFNGCLKPDTSSHESYLARAYRILWRLDSLCQNDIVQTKLCCAMAMRATWK